jgi:hypothetical protein
MKTTGYVRLALILSLAASVLMILSVSGAKTQHALEFRDPIVTNRDNVDTPPFSAQNQRRIVPQSIAATFTVTRSDDIPERGTCAVGDCTLREAIIASNNTAGTDTISFSAGLNRVPITEVLDTQIMKTIAAHPAAKPFGRYAVNVDQLGVSFPNIR